MIMTSVAMAAVWTLPAFAPSTEPSEVTNPNEQRLSQILEAPSETQLQLQSGTDTKGLVDAGLTYLAEHQNADGSFGGNDSRIIRVGLSALSTLSIILKPPPFAEQIIK